MGSPRGLNLIPLTGVPGCLILIILLGLVASWRVSDNGRSSSSLSKPRFFDSISFLVGFDVLPALDLVTVGVGAGEVAAGVPGWLPLNFLRLILIFSVEGVEAVLSLSLGLGLSGLDGGGMLWLVSSLSVGFALMEDMMWI